MRCVHLCLEKVMFLISLMMISRDSGVSRAQQPLIPAAEKRNICQICGDKGDLKLLIFCVQCQVSAEHSYCMARPPTEGDGTVIWKCEECAPKDANCYSEPLRKSGRISRAIEAKHKRMKLQKITPPVRKEKPSNLPIHGHARAHTDSSSQEKSSDYLDTVDGVQDLPIKRRRLVLEDEKFESIEGPLNMSSDQALEVGKYVCSEPIDGNDRLSEPTEVNRPNINLAYDDPCNVSTDLHCPMPNRYIQAEPITDPVWRGQFRINNIYLLGLAAHVSNKACSKVHCAATWLPALADVELLPRFDIWPQGFQTSPLTDDCIALYFFPRCERDEKDFDSVLDVVIEHDLALKTVVNNVDLLIFTSRILPPEHWRICQKYYLWGVFRAKRINSVHSLASDEVAVSNQHPFKS